jgi:hypothetical protein
MISIEAYAFVARKAARTLRDVDDQTAAALAVELQSLPTLEATSRMAPIKGLPRAYRSLTLPSGYLVLYRRLTPVEIRNVTGGYADRDAYLVADLVHVINESEVDGEPTEIVTLPE